MELIAIIFILWLIGCAFPGSGQNYGPDIGEVLGFITCALFLMALVFVWGYSVAGILVAAEWLGVTHPGAVIFALLIPIAIPMIVAACVNGYRDRRDQRCSN